MTATRRRRAGVLPKVGLVVEGDSEFLAFRRLNSQRLSPPWPPLDPVNLGGVGSDITPIGIAKRVAPKVISHLIRGYSKVVVCFDREQRPEGPSTLAESVTKALAVELTVKGQSMQGVHIVVMNRAFEAWLLAGWPALRKAKKFVKDPKWMCFEGELGKEAKKGVVELDELLGRPYRKTDDGPVLFCLLDFVAARDHGPGKAGSKSLDQFLRTIGI